MVQRHLSHRLAPALLFIVLGPACIPSGMVRSATRDGMKPILENGIDGFISEPDLMVAEGAIAANLKLIEGVALTYPEETGFRVMAAMARATYAFAFIQDELEAVKITYPDDSNRREALIARAVAHYKVGRAHAEAALRIQNEDFVDALGGATLEEAELATFDAALATLTPEDAGALFWLTFNWGGQVQVKLNVADATMLPKLERMVGRALELDEPYFYGVGPNLLSGTLQGFRAPAIGGNPEGAAKHFDRAKELGNGAFLPDVMKAQFVYAQTENLDAFESTLTQVINSTVSPDLALLDALAQRKACRLYANLDNFFLADAKPVPTRCERVPQKHPLREVD